MKLALDSNVMLPANATAKVAQTSLLGSLHVESGGARRGSPTGGWLKQGSEIPQSHTGRYPTTEEVLSALGVVVNKGNVGALEEITDETYAAVAGRQGQFVDLIPRLAELTKSLDAQVNDIISAIDGLNRFAAILARTRTTWAARWTPCRAPSACSTTTEDHIVDAFAALKSWPRSRRPGAQATKDGLHRRPQRPVLGGKGAQRRAERIRHLACNYCRRSRSPNFGIKQAVRGDYLNVFTTFDLTLRRLGETFFTTSACLDPNMMHMSEVLNPPDFLIGEMANLSGQAADPFKIPPGTATQHDR